MSAATRLARKLRRRGFKTEVSETNVNAVDGWDSDGLGFSFRVVFGRTSIKYFCMNAEVGSWPAQSVGEAAVWIMTMFDLYTEHLREGFSRESFAVVGSKD